MFKLADAPQIIVTPIYIFFRTDTFTVTSPGHTNPVPKICGTNSGEHGKPQYARN